MKYVAVICLLALSILVTGQNTEGSEKGFIINVSLSNKILAENNLRLIYKKDGEFIRDSVYTRKDGLFVFKGRVAYPTPAILQVYNKELGIKLRDDKTVMNPVLTLILSNENISVAGDAKNIHLATVTGGKWNDEWLAIKKISNQVTHRSWLEYKLELANQINKIDTTAVKEELKLISTQLDIRLSEKMEKRYIDENPDSFLSLYFLSNYSASMETDALKIYFSQLGEQFKNSPIGLSLAKYISNRVDTENGAFAPTFKKKDKDGNLIDLNFYFGKVIVLDFWGSWCGPCRENNPLLKKIYTNYKERGVELISISYEVDKDLSRARNKWLKAIEEDEMNWTQILSNEDVGGMDLIEHYAVNIYPTIVLIDKDLKIIATYTGDKISENLEQQIEKLLK